MEEMIVRNKSTMRSLGGMLVLLTLMLRFGEQTLLAQSTIYVTDHQVRHIEKTNDGGFLAYTGRLSTYKFSYLKFDSLATFQYGYESDYEQQLLNVSSRNGKMFTCLRGGAHEFIIAKIDIATGVMERTIRVNCTEGQQDYLNLGPHRLLATQDGGLIVVPSKEQCQEIVGCLMCHFKFDSNLDLVYINGTSFNALSLTGVTSIVAESPEGSIVRAGSLALGPGNNASFVLRHHATTGTVLNQFLFKDSISVPVANGLVCDSNQILFLGNIYGGSHYGAVMALPYNLSSPNWYYHYATTTGNQYFSGFVADPRNNAYVCNLNDVVFGMDLNGQILWKRRSDSVPYHTGMTPLASSTIACLIPGGNTNYIELLDSAGLGICDTATCSIYPIPAGTLPTPSGASSSFYNVVQVDTLPPHFFSPLSANPQTLCTYLCTFQAAFTQQSCDLQAQFYSSTPQAYTHDWNFGDGTTGSGHSPTHTYSVAGTYMVCYIASTTCMSDTICQWITIAPLNTSASFSVSGSFPTFTFQDQSTGSPMAWFWDFGDGSTSTLQSPSHTYAAPGNYLACLIVTLDCIQDTTCQPLTIASVRPAQTGNTFCLYPVPASDKLYIRQATGKLDPVKLTVYAANGRKVFSFTLQAEEMMIDINGLASGIYFMEAMSAQGKWHCKFVVARE